jgi:hypothetical protein
LPMRFTIVFNRENGPGSATIIEAFGENEEIVRPTAPRRHWIRSQLHRHVREESV